MWEIVIPGAFALIGVAIGTGGTLISERTRSKIELEKQNIIANHELAKQKAIESHELRQSIRGELFDEIIDLLGNEFADARRIASELQALGVKKSAQSAAQVKASARLRELEGCSPKNTGDIMKYRGEQERFDRLLVVSYSEMSEKLDELMIARRAFNDKATRARVVSPDDVAEVIEAIDLQLGLIITRSEDEDGVKYDPANLERIFDLDRYKAQLITVVRNWVHQ